MLRNDKESLEIEDIFQAILSINERYVKALDFITEAYLHTTAENNDLSIIAHKHVAIVRKEYLENV